jgi:hemin uptake protein HemP
MRSKTLALVSTPRSTTLSTRPLDAPAAPGAAEQSTGTPKPSVRLSTMPGVDPTAVVPQWQSSQLLAGGDEALISHGGQVYRLRRTTTGKLILTK